MSQWCSNRSIDRVVEYRASNNRCPSISRLSIKPTPLTHSNPIASSINLSISNASLSVSLSLSSSVCLAYRSKNKSHIPLTISISLSHKHRLPSSSSSSYPSQQAIERACTIHSTAASLARAPRVALLPIPSHRTRLLISPSFVVEGLLQSDPSIARSVAIAVIIRTRLAR